MVYIYNGSLKFSGMGFNIYFQYYPFLGLHVIQSVSWGMPLQWLHFIESKKDRNSGEEKKGRHCFFCLRKQRFIWLTFRLCQRKRERSQHDLIAEERFQRKTPLQWNWQIDLRTQWNRTDGDTVSAFAAAMAGSKRETNKRWSKATERCRNSFKQWMKFSVKRS